MDRIGEIIREQIELLIEREMKTSIPLPKLVSILSKYNFLLPYEITKEGEKSPSVTLYYKYNNDNNNVDKDAALRKDFDKLQDIVKRAGWTISSCGNYYDGLRNLYKRYQDRHPEFGVGTFFVNLETEHGQTMDDYFGTETFELKHDDYYEPSKSMGDNERLGVIYHRGIFYHFTERKNLKSILAHGLRPKNGGGITVWRNTSPRIYLSLLPEFDKIDYGYNNEETPNDTVLLKIDLRPVMNNFVFYVDDKYENAVYTTSNIPPNFIEVVNCEEIHSKYYFRFAMEKFFWEIVEKNFGNCSENIKKRKIQEYAFEIMMKMKENIKRLCKWWNIKMEYVGDPSYIIKDIIRNAYY